MKGTDLASHHSVSLQDIEDAELRRKISSAINLMDNTNRGTVAEVLVASALGGVVTDTWGDWDVTLDGGIRVEVKATGLVQAWPQTRPSTPSWGVGRSEGWVLVDGFYEIDPILERRSDFYVFGVHDGVRPDRSSEWRFYVVATQSIDDLLSDQKSITESSLVDRFGVEPMTFSDLSQEGLSRPKHLCIS
jgi:hypothetical protein